MTTHPAVVFVGVELEPASARRHRARVELRRPPAEGVVGVAEDLDPLRAAAQATVNALLTIVGLGDGGLILRSVATFDTFGATAVGVALVGRYRDQTRSLVGFAQVTDQPARAAVLAVLNGANRFLGLR